MFCRNCGNQLKDEARFCAECGTPVLPPVTPSQDPPAAEVPVSTPPVEDAAPPVTFDAPPAPQPEAAPAPVWSQPQETPYTPAAEPVQEAPAAPVDIPPVYTAPVTPAPKKSKKGLIIGLSIALVVVIAVVGVFLWMNNRAEKYDAAWTAMLDGNYEEALELFTQLGNYEDSAEQVAYLEGLENDYQQALSDLKAQKFQKAYDAFWDLLDYKDSEEYADYKVPFAAASYLKDCADNGVLPNDDMLSELELDANADIFQNQLLMYEYAADEFYYLEGAEAQALAEECYLNCALMNLELGDFGTADYFASYLSDRYSEYSDAYLSFCADNAMLADMRECVDYFYYGSYTGEEYVAFLSQMIEKLYAYEDQYFNNWELQYLAYDYASALEAELASYNGSKIVTDYNYYMACANQSRVIEQLIEMVDFLSDDTTLRDIYIGEYVYYEACAEVADDLYYSINGQSIEQDNGGYYVTYTNGTAYTVTMVFNFTFQDMNEEVLADSEDAVIEVAPGETVKLYMDAPEEIIDDWYYWIFNRVFDISAG